MAASDGRSVRRLSPERRRLRTILLTNLLSGRDGMDRDALVVRVLFTPAAGADDHMDLVAPPGEGLCGDVHVRADSPHHAWGGYS
jgi:hypothetical protein